MAIEPKRVATSTVRRGRSRRETAWRRTPIDVVIAGPGVDEDFLARAVTVEVAGRKLPVLAADDDLDIITDEITGLDPARLTADEQQAQRTLRLVYEYQDTRFTGTIRVSRKPVRVAAQTLAYHRLDRDNMELVMTITDPKTYTKPWVSDKKALRLSPNAEFVDELFCVPSEEQAFNRRLRDVAGGVIHKE